MTRIRLRIGEIWGQSTARILAIMDRIEAGEAVPECSEYEFGFVSWEHFTAVLQEDAPELAAELLAMPEGDRLRLFDTATGQEALQRLWARFDCDTSCPG